MGAMNNTKKNEKEIKKEIKNKNKTKNSFLSVFFSTFLNLKSQSSASSVPQSPDLPQSQQVIRTLDSKTAVSVLRQRHHTLDTE